MFSFFSSPSPVCPSGCRRGSLRGLRFLVGQTVDVRRQQMHLASPRNSPCAGMRPLRPSLIDFTIAPWLPPYNQTLSVRFVHPWPDCPCIRTVAGDTELLELFLARNGGLGIDLAPGKAHDIFTDVMRTLAASTAPHGGMAPLRPSMILALMVSAGRHTTSLDLAGWGNPGHRRRPNRDRLCNRS